MATMKLKLLTFKTFFNNLNFSKLLIKINERTEKKEKKIRVLLKYYSTYFIFKKVFNKCYFILKIYSSHNNYYEKSNIKIRNIKKYLKMSIQENKKIYFICLFPYLKKIETYLFNSFCSSTFQRIEFLKLKEIFKIFIVL